MAQDKRKPSVAQRLADLELEVEALSQQIVRKEIDSHTQERPLVWLGDDWNPPKPTLWQRIKGYFRG